MKLIDSPRWGLWEENLCGYPNSSLDGWWWKLKLCCQEGTPAKIFTSKASTMSRAAQGSTYTVTITEEIFIAPYVCSLDTVSFVTLISEHITSLWDTRNRIKFSCWNSVPRRQGWMSAESSLYYFLWILQFPKGLTSLHFILTFS